MSFLKKCCVCTCVLSLSGLAALGQENPRAFLSRPGEEGGQPTSGNTSLSMNAGENAVIHAFVDGTGDAQELQGYQMVWRDVATPQAGATGTVSYRDLPNFTFPQPGPPPLANSNTVNFDLGNGNPALNCTGLGALTTTEILGGTNVNGFGMIQSNGSLFIGCAVPGIAYLGEFEFTASPDACGTFVLDWVPNGGVPSGGTGLTIASGLEYVLGTSDLQSLTITVGGGDDCAAPNMASDGTNSYTNTCATEDGTDTCDASGDTWYSYMATCTGTLNVTSNGTAIPAVYDTANACMASDGNSILCGNGDAAGLVSAGQTYTIQLNGSDNNTFDVTCTAACNIGDTYSAGDASNQLVLDCVDNSGLTDGVDVDLQCTDIACTASGCIFSAGSSACSDGDVCTLTDSCSGGPLGATGGASCAGSNINTCNDFSDCTADSCDDANGGDGCANADLNGAACTPGAAGDMFCQSGGNLSASCSAGGTCDCTSGVSTCCDNALCLDVRNAGDRVGGPSCETDADCMGGLSCVDTDMDPINGNSICVDQACYNPGEQIIVDVEFGNATEVINGALNGACGAQLFLAYDNTTLDLKSVETDPDGEFNWGLVLVNIANESAGEIDLALGLPVGTTCGGANMTVTGGTIVRLTFNSIADCKSGGVWFRGHNPPTKVSGPKGGINLQPCSNDTVTDEIDVNPAPEWSCPPNMDLDSDCGSNLATIDIDPISANDACDQVSDPGADCTISYSPACTDSLDCELGDLCADGNDCGSGICIADGLAAGFNGGTCTGACTGFCEVTACVDGLCAKSIQLPGLTDILNGGVHSLPPGQVSISCSSTNSCGQTGSCDSTISNSGLNRLCIDVEMSPSMAAGSANNTIDRCVDFELSICDDNGQTTVHAFSQLITFGAPFNIPGHGSTCVKVPPANWTCLTAKDPKHSLTSTCFIECVDDEYRAEFKGSPTTNPLCHWLIQGNVDQDERIDISDYTILAGQYLQVLGNDTPCKNETPMGNNFHSDLNGDGLVTLADFTFVIFNFFELSKDACDVICGGSPAPVNVPQSEITVRELTARGLGEYAQAADVNGDGKVNLTDVGLFLEVNGGNDTLTRDLKDAVQNRAASSSNSLR